MSERYTYNPGRLNALEELYSKQERDPLGDHMTLDDMDELEWQRAVRARAIAAAKNRKVSEGVDGRDDLQQEAKETPTGLGERLAELRDTRLRKPQAGVPDEVFKVTPSASRPGLERLKRAFSSR